MSKQLSDEMLTKLRKLAEHDDTIPEDDTVYDYAGGNVDDAYSMGVSHGAAGLAKDILTSLGE